MVDKVWIAQGWDVSVWDQSQYVWDGQKGFNAALGTVTVNGNSVNLVYGKRLPLQTGTVTVNGIPVTLAAGRSFQAQRGTVNVNFISANLRAALRVGAVTSPVTVNGPDVVLRSGRSFKVTTGSIFINQNAADFAVGFKAAYHLVCDRGQIRVNGVAGYCNLTLFKQPGELNFGIPRVVVSGRW